MTTSYFFPETFISMKQRKNSCEINVWKCTFCCRNKYRKQLVKFWVPKLKPFAGACEVVAKPLAVNSSFTGNSNNQPEWPDDLKKKCPIFQKVTKIVSKLKKAKISTSKFQTTFETLKYPYQIKFRNCLFGRKCDIPAEAKISPKCCQIDEKSLIWSPYIQ